MPAVAVIVDVVATDVIGSSIATAVADVVGSTFIGNVVSGAVIGALGGASQAAVEGQNIWQGAVRGAEAAGITAGIAPEITQGAESLGLSPSVASAVGKGLATTTADVALGVPFKNALEMGGIAGLTSYAFPGKDIGSQLERGVATAGLDKLVAPKQAGIGQLGAAPITGQYAKTQTTPGTGALSQALGVGDVGAPVLGGGTDNTSKKNVWNVESLRYMGGGGPSESGYG